MSANEQRVEKLQRRMGDDKIDVAVLNDPGTIYYYTGYHSYLFMDFGRPTILVVPRSGFCTVVTPTLESEMAGKMSGLGDLDVLPWLDGQEREWMGPLAKVLAPFRSSRIAVDRYEAPYVVLEGMTREFPSAKIVDASDTVLELRMIKSPEEIEVARQAGQVAVAMVEGAAAVIAEGVPEYEIALAMSAAGTRKAAELLDKHGRHPLMSPTMHFHQIMAAGTETAMCHKRSTRRRIQRGDPIFLCFCGITEFCRFHLGFDRMFFVGDVTDEVARIYDIAVQSQRVAFDTIRPGITAEEVHKAWAEVIREGGFEYPYRCGRATGYRDVEKPQLKFGDKTVLQRGMVFAVDGGATLPGVFRSQVGDAVVVTEDGCEILTEYPRGLESLTIR